MSEGRMKLPSQRAGLPGKEISPILCPLTRLKGGAYGARSGQKGLCLFLTFHRWGSMITLMESFAAITN